MRVLRGVRFATIVFDCPNPARLRATRAVGSARVRLGLRAVGLVALTLAMVVIAWIDPSSLCALPALALALLLAVRRYPGERALAAFAAARGERRPRPAASVLHSARATVTPPRGGLLLAFALAVRPPPLVSRAAA
ncbi:MAG TPA: hypothetical protein VGI76_03425 [Solirubrobacteraceae bacterium]